MDKKYISIVFNWRMEGCNLLLMPKGSHNAPRTFRDDKNENQMQNQLLH